MTQPGNAIRTARKRAGLTQADIASAMKVTRAAVGQWEREETFPSYARVAKLCEILDLDVSEIIALFSKRARDVGYSLPLSKTVSDNITASENCLHDNLLAPGPSDPISEISELRRRLEKLEAGFIATHFGLVKVARQAKSRRAVVDDLLDISFQLEEDNPWANDTRFAKDAIDSLIEAILAEDDYEKPIKKKVRLAKI